MCILGSQKIWHRSQTESYASSLPMVMRVFSLKQKGLESGPQIEMKYFKIAFKFSYAHFCGEMNVAS